MEMNQVTASKVLYGYWRVQEKQWAYLNAGLYLCKKQEAVGVQERLWQEKIIFLSDLSSDYFCDALINLTIHFSVWFDSIIDYFPINWPTKQLI